MCVVLCLCGCVCAPCLRYLAKEKPWIHLSDYLLSYTSRFYLLPVFNEILSQFDLF